MLSEFPVAWKLHRVPGTPCVDRKVRSAERAAVTRIISHLARSQRTSFPASSLDSESSLTVEAPPARSRRQPERPGLVVIGIRTTNIWCDCESIHEFPIIQRLLRLQGEVSVPVVLV
jgi:hypothetical protein